MRRLLVWLAPVAVALVAGCGGDGILDNEMPVGSTGKVTAAPAEAPNLYVVVPTMDAVLEFDGATGEELGTYAQATGGGAAYGLDCGVDGRLFVTREAANDVVVFDAEGGLIGTFVDSGLNHPTGVAVGPDGHVYVANRYPASIREYDREGNYQRSLPFTLNGAPFSLAFGPNGKLYVALGFAGSGVAELDLQTPNMRVIPTGDDPRDISFGPDGLLYVALSGQGRTAVAVDVEKGEVVQVFDGDMISPHGVALGPNGDLFVADYTGRTIKEFDTTTGDMVGTFVRGLPSALELRFGLCGPAPIEVPVEIGPGSGSSTYNCAMSSKGVLPVAILSTAYLNTSEIDLATLAVGAARETHIQKKTGQPIRHASDVNGDGLLDLVVHVRYGESGLNCESEELLVSGMTYDGRQIQTVVAVSSK